MADLRRRLSAEALGSFFLFAGVIGSGIMAERLAGGNDGVALIANTGATGAILFVLITMLAPVSGCHINPAVTLAMALRREIGARDAVLYVLVQLVAGVLAAWAAHLMFEVPILQFSARERTGLGQWAGEFVATFGLVLTIIGTLRHKPQAIARRSRSISPPPTGSPPRPASPTPRSPWRAACRTVSRGSPRRMSRALSRRNWLGRWLRCCWADGCLRPGPAR